MKANKQHMRIPADADTYVHAVLIQPVSIPQKQTLFVFSHGFTADGAEGARLFIRLSDTMLALGYPCILFDYRGSGYSDAEVSANLEHMQVELAKSAKRIGYITIWITIVGIILTLIQVYMVLRK